MTAAEVFVLRREVGHVTDAVAAFARQFGPRETALLLRTLADSVDPAGEAVPCRACGSPTMPDVNGAGEVESPARVCVECGRRA